MNWLSRNGQALALLPFPQEHLSFGSCFTSALGHTYNFSSFRTSFVTDKIWTTNEYENIKYLPCLKERWSRSTWKCVSWQGWFMYSFHPWHENGTCINWLIVQDGVVSLALGFCAQNSPLSCACSRACQGVEMLDPLLFAAACSGIPSLNSWKGHLVFP